MINEQLKIASKVICNNSFKILNYVAGLDNNFVKNDPVNAAVGIVILEYPSLKQVYSRFF